MKKIFLILTIFMLTISAVLSITGCKTEEEMQPAVVEFAGGDFDLSLPENWEGGTKEELDSVAEDLEDLGQDELAADIEKNKVYLLFFGYDSTAASGGDGISNLTVTGETAPLLSLEKYMDLTYKDLAEKYEEAGFAFKVAEQDIVSLGNYDEVGRAIVEQEAGGKKLKVVQYIIKDGSDFWVLTFTALHKDFDENIEIFDEVSRTFKIKD